MDAPHQQKLDEALEALERRDIRRLIVTMPPRHGKSEKTSVRFPAWFLGRQPTSQVIMASYNATLAYKFSRQCRNLIRDESYPFADRCRIAADSKSVKTWATEQGGAVVAAGVGGDQTGHGAHLLVIDDYLKNQADASSELIREKQWEWYTAAARTRLMPSGVIVITATRWHEDDLIGRVLGQPGAANEWVVLELPAVAGWPDAIGRRLPTWPETGDILGRAEGRALWPAWYDETALGEIRADVGERVFTALYLCRPTAAAGDVFKRAWMNRRWRELPTLRAVFQSVDSSFKDGVGSDYSVGATWGTDGVDYYLLDRWRARVQFPELKAAIKDNWLKWRGFGPGVAGVLVEDTANAVAAIQELRRESDVPLLPVKAVVSKVARAESIAPLFEAGKVVLPEEAPWLSEWIEEHAGFPNAVHDDQVDTTSQALARLSGRGVPGYLTFVQQQAARLQAERLQAQAPAAPPPAPPAPDDEDDRIDTPRVVSSTSAGGGFLDLARRHLGGA